MKNEKYQAPLNIYISSSYDDAELAQKFLSDYVKGFGITVDKQRNGDELYVTIDGLDEDIDTLVSVYTAQYDEFKKDCKAEPSGWVSPVNFEKSKEDESMKSESNIEDLRDQTISWGTMRSEDLIPKFLGVLKTYAKDKYDEYVNENPEVLDIDGLDDETLGWIVDELFDKLDEIAPEGTYFGAHPDDGADYGFWSVDESKQRESKKSEAYEDIWRGAKVMTHDEACEQLDYVKEIEDDIISEYGEDYYEDPDAVDEYNQRINNYIDSCFDQDFVSIDGEEIPLGVSRDPKLLIVLTDDTEHGDEAVELVKKLANGELTGSSDDGDYVAIMNGVSGSPHFDIYSEEPKSEGKSDKDGKDDKDCKGKGCDGSDEKCGGDKKKENRGKPQEGSSASNNWVAYYFCKDPQGLEWAVLPHTVSMIGNVNCVNARGGMESIGKEYVLSKCTPVEDVESSEIWKAVCDGEDRKVVAINRDDAERVLRAENGLEELKSVVAGKDESKKNEKGTTKIETYEGFDELLGYADAEYLLEDVVDVLSKYYTYEDETFDEDQAKDDPEFTIKIEGGDERANYYYENKFYVHLPSKDAAEELAKVLGGELNESKKNENSATPEQEILRIFKELSESGKSIAEYIDMEDVQDNMDELMDIFVNKWDNSPFEDGHFVWHLDEDPDGNVDDDSEADMWDGIATFITDEVLELLGIPNDGNPSKNWKELQYYLFYDVFERVYDHPEENESKKNENRTKEEEITNIFKGMKDWASKYPNDPNRKIIADNLDLDAVQDNMSDIVEVMDKAFEWDGYDYMYPVKDYGDDDDARDKAEASQWDACYSVCEEIADIIGVPDEGHSIGEMNIYFWEEIEQTFTSEESANKTEAKKSKSTENTTESERISFIKDLANKLGIDNLKENRASAHMSGWRYFNNDDEGGDGVVLSLKAYPWARDDQSATIDVWLETDSGVIGDCWLSFDFGGDYKNRINADTILTTLKTQLHTLWSQREGVAKKSEDFDMNKAFFQAKKAITDWTKRQGHKTLEWLYTDGRKSPTSYPSGIWDFEWDTGNGMATAELKVSPYETRTNSWNDSMDFSLKVGTEDKPTFYTSVEDVLYALDTLISKTEIKMESKKSESLTLKQAELKKMAKYGEAEDITGLSDAEAKELKKSGVELVGISRGTYGMNGALMRGTADGKLYVITSRNSNLFYFV